MADFEPWPRRIALLFSLLQPLTERKVSPTYSSDQVLHSTEQMAQVVESIGSGSLAVKSDFSGLGVMFDVDLDGDNTSILLC